MNMHVPSQEAPEALMLAMGARARAAAKAVREASAATRSAALSAIAHHIRTAAPAILAANETDMTRSAAEGLSPSMLDRLKLDSARLEAMAAAVEDVASQPDQLGEVMKDWTRPNGLHMQRVRIPIGVIGIIYESRPNVTADAGALCLRSGNCVILRGGSDAIGSSTEITKALRAGLAEAGLPEDAIQLVGTTDRAAVGAMLAGLDGSIDMIIPRGGKSLVARAMHRRSTRRDKPFVEVACGALPENLLESELFGHVAGAFTGATGDKQGKFLQAAGGTIFLDEIGTASPAMQVKLLRVLQEFEFEPVGGNKTYHVDTRVILATNEDLSKLVADGRFRQDLFYRVNVINVELPPLRERISDIPLLAKHFLEEVCEEAGKTLRSLSSDALAALQRYGWPGNVRELENVVERAVLLGKSETIQLDDLPRAVAAAGPIAAESGSNRTLKEALSAPERRIIFDVLESNDWNRFATAETLGINRTTLYKKLKRLGMDLASLEPVR